MNTQPAFTLLALSLALASNLALAHAGHDHKGHAEPPPAASQKDQRALCRRFAAEPGRHAGAAGERPGR